MNDKPTKTPNLVVQWTLSSDPAIRWQKLNFGWYRPLVIHGFLPVGKSSSPETSDLDLIESEAIYNKAAELINEAIKLLQPPLEEIKAYDLAIQLLQQLNLNKPQYCYALSVAHLNKGLALQAFGSVPRLEQAVAEYDEVIRLRRTLDLANAEYCSVLANAHLNKGVALEAFGSVPRLEQALAEYDEAIRLRRTLDLANAEYCNDLAKAHLNKGNVLQTFGSVPRLEQAIEEYDEAIRLRRTLDLANAKYCKALALAYMNKGLAIQSFGSVPRLERALEEYDEAIRLGRTLDLANAEYCNDLARAHLGKGNALQTFGTAPRLERALEEYDEAIQLGRTLDLANAKYCNVLAGTHLDKGNALKAFGTVPRLEQAIAEYDEAIRLGRTLDLANAEYCNNLACAHLGKGNALKAFGAPSALIRAVACYDQAIHLLKDAMNWPASQRMLAMVRVIGLVYWNKARCFLQSNQPGIAGDAADDGLALLREQEVGGFFQWRELRENLFSTTLQAYTQSGQFQFLSEIVLEHLDPINPGSAHTSAKMQEAAFYHLRRAIEKLSTRSDLLSDLLKEINQTLERLTYLRTLYFGGTALSIRLQAVEMERMGNPDDARQLFEKYLEFRPSDPEIHLEFAAFLVRQQQINAAINVYHNAATQLIRRAQARGEMEVSIEPIATIADNILQLKLLHQYSSEPDKKEWEEGQLEHVLKLKDWLLMDFTNRLFAADCLQQVGHKWRNHMGSSLKIVAEKLELYHNRLITQLKNRVRADAQKDAWDDFNELTRSMARTLCAGIGLPWSDFEEGVTAAWLERWSYFKKEWFQASAEQRAVLEEQIAHGLAYTVGELTRQLHEKILTDSYAHLQQTLGTDIWKTFRDSEEARFLACGHHWLQLPPTANSARYAGLELGLAVETCLLQRVFVPLRDWFLKSGEHDAITIASDDFSFKTGQFLKGQISAVEFGPMAGALGRTLKYLDAPDQLTGSSYYRALADYLQHLPNPAPLRDATARKRRVAALETIKQQRNRCAHPHTLPTVEELQTLWAQVVGDPGNGFFRYFGAALIPPPTAPTPT